MHNIASEVDNIAKEYTFVTMRYIYSLFKLRKKLSTLLGMIGSLLLSCGGGGRRERIASI